MTGSEYSKRGSDSAGENPAARQRILILTADAGLGHRRAAEAIDAALSNRYGEAAVTRLVNPLTLADAPGFIQKLEESYSDHVVEDRNLYRLSYHALDLPVISEITIQVMSRVLDDLMQQLITEFRPHVIVTTYPAYAQPCIKAIEDLERATPVAVAVTDLTNVQSIWYSADAALHFAPTEAIRQQAIENGIPPDRVQVTGLPVDPAFAQETRSRMALRRELGWQTDLPVGLVVASPRTSQMNNIVRVLDAAQMELQLAVVCGGDHNLYRQLQNQKWRGNVHLYDWVDEMPPLMKAADFMVSKAGGLIVSEALACGLPLIISEALPGQEVGNVQHVIDHSAGAWAPGPLEVLSTIHQWLRDEAQLKQVRQNAERLGQPEAADTIARRIRALGEQSAE